MISLLAFFLVNEASLAAQGTTLVCTRDNGPAFSLYVPASTDGERGYAIFGLAVPERPGSVVGSLDGNLSLFWQREDGGETMLDIVRFNAASGTASYRMRSESDPSAPITSVASSDGYCVRRRDAMVEGGAQ